MSSRRLALLLSGIALLVPTTRAFVPDVRGMLVSTYLSGTASLQGSFRLEWMKPDGSYVVLANSTRNYGSWPSGDLGGPWNSPAETGTYTYTPDPENRVAQLRIGDWNRQIMFHGERFGTEGMALVDFLPPATSTAQNVSNRTYIKPGTPAITGLVINEARWALIRGIGPTLGEFGVSQPAGATRLEIFSMRDGTAFPIRHVAGWKPPSADPSRTSLEYVFDLVGAFPLQPNSGDAAILLLLRAGVYSIHLGLLEGEAEGEALVEVYFLPFDASPPTLY